LLKLLPGVEDLPGHLEPVEAERLLGAEAEPRQVVTPLACSASSIVSVDATSCTEPSGGPGEHVSQRREELS
jgi:hypothetical protein